jgi:hypothetical protein
VWVSSVKEDDFITRFREQLHHASDFVTVALNAHLEIEGELDEYLSLIFEHSKYLDDARLSYFDKVCIARAYTPVSHDRFEWEVMIFINAMRNKIAHRSRKKALKIDVGQLRTTLLDNATSLRNIVDGGDHKEVVIYAAAICSGFLAVLQEQLAQHKGIELGENE